MRIKPTEKKSEIEKLPAGDYRMYLYMCVHMGAHSGDPKYSPSHKYYFGFETPDTTKKFRDDEPERPFAIGRTAWGGKSANAFYEDLRDNNLTEDEKINGWDTSLIMGKLFDIQVTHDPAKKDPSTIYANIRKIRKVYSEIPKDVAAMTNKAVTFSIDSNPETGEPFMTASQVIACTQFQALPKWMRNEIRKSEQFKAFADAGSFPKEE